MTKEQKIDYLSRLFMYGAKVGYDADITVVEYFMYSIAADMGINAEGVLTSEHVTDTAQLNASEDAVFDKIRAQLIALNA